jgi:hypothetical protein
MTFELLDQLCDLLQRQERVSYRALKIRFQLDDGYLEGLKDELIYAQKLAETYGRIGQAEEGLRLLAAALTVVDKGNRWYEAKLHRIKGELLLQSGVQRPESDVFTPHSALCIPHSEEAATCFQQALAVARHQQARSVVNA